MQKTRNNFFHKHSLGQNFLRDEFVLDDIVIGSDVAPADFVLEIGPGNGALTRVLAEKVKYVVAVEIDKTLLPLLKSNLSSYNNITIINADFINYDFSNIVNEFAKHGFNSGKDKIKVVANLPYYITSPIIMSLLQNNYISDITIMVQKEVAERIVANPKTRDFGILTLACQYYADATCLFIVPKTCFFPVPKVDSAVVKFVKHKIDDTVDYEKLFSLIKASFAERRKKLINSISDTLKIDKSTIFSALEKLNLSELVRAEELSLDDYKNLLKIL